MKKNLSSTDHLGNEHPNWKVMCKSHGVNPLVFEKRIRGGMDLETALTPSRNAMKPCTDHTGREFRSLNAMYAAWNISLSTYSHRIERGLTVKEALTAPLGTAPKAKPVKDHTGQEFPSQKAMCEARGVRTDTYRHRLKSGMSIEEALTWICQGE